MNMLRARRLLPLLASCAVAAGCSLVIRPDPVEVGEDAREDDVHVVSVATIDSGTIAPGVESAYWDKVRAGGPLVVGINPNTPPFGLPVAYVREGAAPFVGFDVDLALHLGETLGVPIEFRGVPSGDVPARLNDGTIDLALAGLTTTAYRAAQVNFSAPYLVVSQAALVERRFVEGSRGTDEERRRNTMESYYDLAGVSGIKIGVAAGTRPERLARSNFPDAQITAYPTIEAASQALVAGELNAIVHDAPYIRVWRLFHQAVAGRFSELLKPVTEEPIAIAVRKGDLEFLRWLDVYASEVRQDGTIDRIYRAHFVDAEWLKTADLGGER